MEDHRSGASNPFSSESYFDKINVAENYSTPVLLLVITHLQYSVNTHLKCHLNMWGEKFSLTFMAPSFPIIIAKFDVESL